MSAGIAPEGPHTGVDGLCVEIRGALAGWVPGILGVHVHRSVAGPADVAQLVGAVADAAEITVLPGDDTTARTELHTAAARALAATWYRPGQVWDPVTQDNERRRARAAITVSAADMLDGRADPARAHIGKVRTFEPKDPAPENWGDHLALWAQLHQEHEGALPLDRCVVDLASPELTGAQLLGVPDMAELGGITASTLRSYISRGNSEVPQPQATVGGRDQWARAVADD
ncbi:hypothetical protein ACFXD5_15490 [Streptomyces sp. NPDC059385]|uniref:hypothetical protein n=1 Tax=Streptomyces sp. NPDC059385 TaxID=3346817 RepID=UPI0036834C52